MDLRVIQIKFRLFLIVIIFFGTQLIDTVLYAVSCGGEIDDCVCGGRNPYPCCDNGGNCTWWAWDQACCNWGVALPGWGDAKTWADFAKQQGWPVSSTPAVGTIAARNTGTWGHVAWVLQVSADGTQVYVSEQNCAGGYGVNYRWYATSWFDDGYIYNKFSGPSAAGTPVDDGNYTTSTTALHFIWTPATDVQNGIAKYYLSIGDTPGGTNVKNDLDVGNTTSYTVTGLSLTSGSTYYAKVKAENTKGDVGPYSGNSNGITVDITSSTVPGTPADDGEFTGYLTQLHFIWPAASDPESNVAKYYLSLGDTPGGTNILSDKDVGNVTNYTATGLTLNVGTTYYAKVKAENGAGLVSSYSGNSNGIYVTNTIFYDDFNYANGRPDLTKWPTVNWSPTVSNQQLYIADTSATRWDEVYTQILTFPTNGYLTFRTKIATNQYCGISFYQGTSTLKAWVRINANKTVILYEGSATQKDTLVLTDDPTGNYVNIRLNVNNGLVSLASSMGSGSTGATANITGANIINLYSGYSQTGDVWIDDVYVRSNQSSDTTAPTVPGTPVDDGFSTISTTQLHFTWIASNDPESGIYRYFISLGNIPGGTGIVNDLDVGNVTECTVTGLSLTAGTTYYAKVKAENGAGLLSTYSGNSNGILVTDVTPPSVPGTPLDDGTTTTVNTELHFTWTVANDPESGIAKYYLSVGDTPGGTNILNNQDVGLVIEYTAMGLNLQTGTTYYAKVIAENGAGLLSTYSGNSNGILVVENDQSLIFYDDFNYANGRPNTTKWPTLNGSPTVSGQQLYIPDISTSRWDEIYSKTVTFPTNGYLTFRTKMVSGQFSGLSFYTGTTSLKAWIKINADRSVILYEGDLTQKDSLTLTNSPVSSFVTIKLKIANGMVSLDSSMGSGSTGAVANFTGANTINIYSGYTPTGNVWFEDLFLVIGDTTPPSAPGYPVDHGETTISTTELHFIWNQAYDAESGISKYYLCIGDTSGGTNVLNDKDVGKVTNYTATGLNLTVGTTYYAKVKAQNNASLTGAYSDNSDGIVVISTGIIDPNIFFYDDFNYADGRPDITKWPTVAGSPTVSNQQLYIPDTRTTGWDEIYSKTITFPTNGYLTLRTKMVTGQYSGISFYTGTTTLVGWVRINSDRTVTLYEGSSTQRDTLTLTTSPVSDYVSVKFNFNNGQVSLDSSMGSGSTGTMANITGANTINIYSGYTPTGNVWFDDLSFTKSNPYVDVTSPTAPGTPTDEGTTTTSTSTLYFTWPAANDPENGITKYYLSVGDTPGGTNILNDKDVGSVITYTATGLNLTVGTTYYAKVKAQNSIGLIGPYSSVSDGIVVVSPTTETYVFYDDFSYADGRPDIAKWPTVAGSPTVSNQQLYIPDTRTTGWDEIYSKTITFPTNGYLTLRTKMVTGQYSGISFYTGTTTLVGWVRINSDRTVTLYEGSSTQRDTLTLTTSPVSDYVSVKFNFNNGRVSLDSSMGSGSTGTTANITGANTINIYSGSTQTGNVWFDDIYVNALTVDSTPPSPPGTPIDEGDSTLSNTQLHFIWTPAIDGESGISKYFLSLGDSPGGTNIVYDLDVGNVLEFTLTGLNLQVDKTYYAKVRAQNGAGVLSTYSNNSDGIRVVSTYDTIKPNNITDLLAKPGTVTGEIILSWTTPGDDGTIGNAVQYDIRYRTDSLLNETNWVTSQQLFGEPLPVVSGTMGTWTIAGFNPGTTYYFALKSADEVPNWSLISNSVYTYAQPDTTPPTSPGTPIDDGASTFVTTQLHFTWPAATDYESGIYKYFLSLGSTPGGTNVVNDLDVGNVIEFTVPNLNLTVGTTYYAKVKAQNNAGLIGSYSNNSDGIVVVPPPETIPPANITDLKAQPGTNYRELKLTWTAPGDDGWSGILQNATFKIFYSTDGAESPLLQNAQITISTSAINPGTILTYHLISLSPGTTYYFRVWTADEIPNWSGTSNSASSYAKPDITPPSVPGTPVDDGDTTISITQLHFTWAVANDPESGINKYYLCIGDSPGGTNVLNDQDVGNNTNHIVSGLNLTVGTTYYAKVRVQNQSGLYSPYSGNSDGIVVVTGPDTTPPAAPGIPQDEGEYTTATTQLKFNWSPAIDLESGIEKYYLCIGNVSGGTNIINDLDVSNTTFYTYMTNLTVGSVYYAKVKAQNNEGLISSYSGNSDGIRVILPIDTVAPSTVNNLTVQSGPGIGEITLNWTTPGDDGTVGMAYRYDFRYRTDTLITSSNWDTSVHVSNEPVPFSAGNVQSLSIKNLVPGVTYYFALKTADEVPNWSSISNSPFTYAKTDTSPPSVPGTPIDDGATLVYGNLLHFTWTPAYDYESVIIKYYITLGDTPGGTNVLNDRDIGNVNEYYVTDINLIVGTTYYVKVKAENIVGLTSLYSNNSDGILILSPLDTLPPGNINNLSLRPGLNPGEIILTWTAPGDDGTIGQLINGSQFRVQYSTSDIGPWTLDNAQVTISTSAINPGQTVLTVLTGLTVGTTYYFHIWTADEVPNWSLTSNVPSIYLKQDAVAPAAVTDLRAISSPLIGDIGGEGKIRLTWTSPGDDGTIGKLTGQYKIQYFTTNGLWSYITAQVTVSTSSVNPGTVSTYILSNLSPGVTYYICLWTSDEVGNWSTESNKPFASASRPGVPPVIPRVEAKPEERFITENVPATFGTEAEEVKVYDPGGGLVIELDKTNADSSGQIVWFGKDKGGSKIESGAYIYKIKKIDGKFTYGILIIAR